MAVFRKYLQRFHEMPVKLPPSHYRSWVLINYSDLMGGIIHFFFIFLFAAIGIFPLALFNIASTVMWALAIYFNLKGMVIAGLILANTEIFLHAFLCTIVIGWNTGFHYYILVMPSVLFLSPLALPAKISLSSANVVLYGLLYYFFQASTPLVPINQKLILAFNYINIATFGFILAYFAYHYRSVVIEVEQKLEKEHQKTNAALVQRNEILTRLNEELAEAAEYVKSKLPTPLSDGPVRADWRFFPSAALGGDAFGYHWIDNDHFAIYLLDVSGHGVGAALLSVSVMNALRSQTLPNTDFKNAKTVLESLNTAFPCEENNDMFFTIWYGVYRKSTRELAYASGGHPPALLLSGRATDGSEAKLLRTPSSVIGGMPEVTYRKEKCLVGEHDRLYIFSDGVYEVEKFDGSMWRFQEFADFMIRAKSEGMPILDQLYRYTEGLCRSNVFEDDFTIVEVSFN